jgi:hypothetical protein
LRGPTSAALFSVFISIFGIFIFLIFVGFYVRGVVVAGTSVLALGRDLQCGATPSEAKKKVVGLIRGIKMKLMHQ